MNMHELPDKDLDNVFRKAADMVEFPMQEEAWQNIERQLDDWERFSKTFWSLLGAGILLLLISFTFLIWKNVSVISSNDNLMKSAPVYGEITFRMPENRQETIGITSENRENMTIQRNISKSTKDIQTGINSVTKNSKSEKLKDIRNAEPDEFPGEVESYNQINTNQIIKNILEGTRLDIPVRISPYFIPLEQPSEPDIESSGYNPEEIIVTPSSNNFGFSIGLSSGPDFSGVGSNPLGAGTYLGMYFELDILNRLDVIIGAYHTRKRYPVKDEYSPPYPGFWTNGQVPDQVKVACHIFDLPVNLNYDVIQRQGFRIFLGAGLSSYLMVTEEYSFEYGYSYDPDLVNEYKLKNENQHYFGIINLSAGYTKYINSRWAWQVEPFYKLPVQDIAAARVRLKSFGTLLSLKYRIN
jgi:hypothetical protein